MSSISVLCVDPDAEARSETVAAIDELPECAVVEAGSITAAKERLSASTVDVLVTEYDLTAGTGLELLEHVREVTPDTGVILYTDADRGRIGTDAFGELVVEYVAKGVPGSTDLLRQLVRSTAHLRIQTAYPVPDAEDERLDALGRYDLDAEALGTSIQRLTELARDHFDVPVASVNILTEHDQEFFACSGADWGTIAREDSVCTHLLTEETPVMVIEDLKADPRFETVETLDELGIRFYAGAKLTTAEGLPLGTFCIYDHEPRTLSADRREALRTFGDLTMDLFELHRGAPGEPEAVPGEDG